MNYNIKGLEKLKDSIWLTTTAQFNWCYDNGSGNNYEKQAAELIRTQDESATALADALDYLDSLLKKTYFKASDLGRAAETSVGTFIEAIVANETAAKADVSAINESLDTISAELDNLTF